jgi:hypothetical protein
MFFKNNRPDPSISYDQRIEELEAELDAARRLIEDQQQVLRANLGALAAAQREGDEPEPPPQPSPAARAGETGSYAEQPPIRLPDFGSRAEGIASQVINAAADRGVIQEPAVRQPPVASAAPRTEPAPPRAEPTAVRTVPAAERREPLRSRPPRRIGLPAVAALAVLAAAAVAVTLSHWSRLSAAGKPLAIKSVQADASRPAEGDVVAPERAAAADADTGPVLEPAIAKPQRAEAQPAEAPRPEPRPAYATPPRRFAAMMARMSMAMNASTHRARRRQASVAFHRRAKPPAAPTDQQSIQRAVEREQSRRPDPGWDEDDDKWVDHF